MGTSKVYGSPKWPGVNTAATNAVSTGHLSDKKITNAIGVFAGAYKKYISPGGSLSGGSGGYSRGRQQSLSRGRGSGGVAGYRAASSGANLASFISTAGKSGLDTALQVFDLSDLRDKSLEEFLDVVAERLSEAGGLIDDEAINRAMAETINELAEEVQTVDEFDALLTSGNINIEEVLQIYYANILAANFEQKEFSVIQEKIPHEQTYAFFQRAREIIRAIVREELAIEKDLTKINWNSKEGLRMADEINREVLDILNP